MKRTLGIIFISLVVAVFTVSARANDVQWIEEDEGQTFADTQNVNLPVKMWVESTADSLITALAVLDTDDRFARLRTLFNTSVDINYIARKVIGRPWRNFDENIRQRYITAFEDYLLYVYAAKPVYLNVTNFNVVNTKYIGTSANVTLAKAVTDFYFNEANGEQQPRTLDFLFTVSQKGDNFKLLDVSVGGISAVTFLSGFYAKQLQKNQDDVYYTLRQLESAVKDAQMKRTLGQEVENPLSFLQESSSATNPPDYIQPEMQPYLQ